MTATRPPRAEPPRAEPARSEQPSEPSAPSARGPLEDERDFLLRSLEDLDDERAAGNVDDGTYARLHADYTARAAAVLRALEQEDAPGAVVEQTPRVSTRRRVLTITGIVAFAVIAAVALAFTLGARLPGDTVTGRSRASSGASSGASSRASEQRALETAAARAPDDADAHRTLARFYLADKQYAKALEEFDRAARLAPTDAESRAYAGWILFLVAGSAPADQQSQLLAGAVSRLDAAVAADPAYADAHFFRGMVRFRGQGDAKGAVPEFQRYLVLAPQGPLADQVRSVLADAVEAAKSQP